MVKFIIGLLLGGFVGISWMCLACVMDDLDELVEDMTDETQPEEEPEEEPDDIWEDSDVFMADWYGDLDV